MIGIWRTILALLVVQGHVYRPWWPAAYAVISFYVISGFLMTLIMQEQYGFSRKGILHFGANRILRIYPSYYFACLVSLLAILIIPTEFVGKFNVQITMPISGSDWWKNLSLISLRAMNVHPKFIPVAWALAVELINYIIIALWAGRSKLTALAFLMVGLGYRLYYAMDHQGFRLTYSTIESGFLPFATGCCIYHFRDYLFAMAHRVNRHIFLCISIGAYVGLFYFAKHSGTPLGWLFYVNVPVTALVLIGLWCIKDDIPKWMKPIDSKIGDLSYPMYLAHWQLAIICAYFFSIPQRSPALFWVTCVVLLIYSLLDIRFVSGKINLIRTRIKQS
jgi:peptidoglycan/LPS O-acetylase OafA/YrhL